MVKNYNTSKNYKRLKELLDNDYEIVCFTTYDFNEYDKNKKDYHPLITTDVCMAKLLDKNNDFAHYNISCRGTGFMTYWITDSNQKYSFEEMCEMYNIEFIEPSINLDLNNNKE